MEILKNNVMLKHSVHTFRYAAVIVIAGILFYILRPEYGKYLLGVGLMVLSAATVLYISFMFRRYGEKKPIE